jgi:hypothetical protein
MVAALLMHNTLPPNSLAVMNNSGGPFQLYR